MISQFNQPHGSTSIFVNKQSIALNFGVTKDEVVYFAAGIDLSGYKVIYDESTQRAYSLPAGIVSGTTAISLDEKAILTHSAGSVDLGELAVQRGEFVTVPGSFNFGHTINVKNELLVHDDEKYRWDGSLPKVVAAGSTPDNSGGVGTGAWVSVGDASLRNELASPSGSSLSGHSNGLSVAENLNNLLAKAQFITPEQFYSNHPGETDWAVMINEAYSYARDHNSSVLLANDYHTASTIVHLDGVTVICTGRIIASPTGTYSYTTALGNEEEAAYVITTENGVFNNAKSSSLYGLTLTYTDNREPSGYTDPHILAKGVVITDTANVYINNLQTFGFLNGGVDVGGISGNGFEIVINKCLAWIYAWTDSEKIGFRCNVTDSTFYDVVTVAYGIGIHNVKGGGNVYFNAHPWGYPLTAANLYPNRQCKIQFLLTGGGTTFFRPYADTITKLDSSQNASRANGGVGFYIDNWRNKIIAAEVAIHNDEISTGMSLAYLVGDASRNEIEFTNINNTSKLGNERVSYDSGYQTALFTNIVRIPEYNAGNLSNLTGSISFNGTGVTSSGTYSLRRSGEYIDILLTIGVTSISSPSGPLSITLPRGLVCRFGPSAEPEQTSCFGNISSINIGVIAVLNGSSIEFYYKTANGARVLINAAGVSVGTLELFLRGKISN
ncbi:tail protein [Escherichia phage 241]|nr:tail protein [Escherichia phage 241]